VAHTYNPSTWGLRQEDCEKEERKGGREGKREEGRIEGWMHLESPQHNIHNV
jgi:hypothetical protein